MLRVVLLPLCVMTAELSERPRRVCCPGKACQSAAR